jgi:hypothetical protein
MYDISCDSYAGSSTATAATSARSPSSGKTTSGLSPRYSFGPSTHLDPLPCVPCRDQAQWLTSLALESIWVALTESAATECTAFEPQAVCRPNTAQGLVKLSARTSWVCGQRPSLCELASHVVRCCCCCGLQNTPHLARSLLDPLLYCLGVCPICPVLLSSGRWLCEAGEVYVNCATSSRCGCDMSGRRVLSQVKCIHCTRDNRVLALLEA